MKPETYKAVIRYPAMSVNALSASIWAHGHNATAAIRHDYVEDKNRTTAAPYFERAIDWLEETSRKTHLLNWYDNTDHVKGIGEIVMVFSDRDTALLLKLAL